MKIYHKLSLMNPFFVNTFAGWLNNETRLIAIASAQSRVGVSLRSLKTYSVISSIRYSAIPDHLSYLFLPSFSWNKPWADFSVSSKYYYPPFIAVNPVIF